ncbi:MAG: DUF4139 domain-containing protein, partial [Gemmataceae bacterium]|nr:DUF4139 domain-containing protein [Gemmataceae bacterium]
YVNRPTMALELFASLRPVAYSGSMEEDGKMMAAARLRDAGRRATVTAAIPTPTAAPPLPPGLPFGGAAPDAAPLAESIKKELKENLDLGRSVSSAATASKLGDFFQYAIGKPVSLARQKSALLPIVTKEVEASRTSIYNEQVQAKFPLLGMRFKNTTGLHLMQGPITVFEGATYAGDAVIRDLQPGEERLLSYAVDLGTEVNPVATDLSGRYLALKAVKGVLHATRKTQKVKAYTIKNRNDSERVVLVEHQVNSDFKLLGEKPRETAADFYRFEVRVPADATRTHVVTEEKEERHEFGFANEGDERIRWFASQPVASAKLKAALQQAMQLRQAQYKAINEEDEAQRQLKAIEADQARLRANLASTPSTAAVYKKYLKKLDDQEEQIEKLQERVEKLAGASHAAKKAFDDYLAAFTTD